jgi:pantetheine-phosphate adenylyltransferase
VDLVRALGVTTLVRGARRDPAAELEMAHANAAVGGVGTLFVPTPPALASISSSLVRSRWAAGGADAIVDLVPAAVRDALTAREQLVVPSPHV